MKKFWGLLLILVVSMFALTACNGEPLDLSVVPREVSVEVEPLKQDYIVGSNADSLDLSGAKLKVVYVDNSVKHIDITKDMLDTSKVDWTKEGAQSVGVLFGTDGVTFSTKFDIWLYAPWAGAENTEWYDAAKTSYMLDAAEQLAGFAKLVREGNTFAGKTVGLGHSMNLSDAYWKGIGASGNAFSGIFDGKGNTVAGLKMDAAVREDAGAYNGFFYAIKDGSVKNFRLTAVDVKTHGWTGALAGHIDNTAVTGVYVSGKIEGAFAKEQFLKGRQNGSAIAGIAEYATNGSVLQNCTADVTLLNNFDMNGIEFDGNASVIAYTGGIVCELNNSAVIGSRSQGAISLKGKGYTYVSNNYPTANAGGIAAYVRYLSTIDNCVNDGAVSAEGFGYTSAAGIAAYLWGDTGNVLTLKNNINNGAISANGGDAYAGGIGAEAYSLYASVDEYFSAVHIITGNANHGAVLVTTDAALINPNNVPAVGGILGWVDRANAYPVDATNINDGALSFVGRPADKGDACGKAYSDEELTEMGYVLA